MPTRTSGSPPESSNLITGCNLRGTRLERLQTNRDTITGSRSLGMRLFFGGRQAGNGVVSADLQQSSKGTVLAHGLMPPYLVLRDFLDEEMVAGLLDYAVSRQSDFTATRIGPNAVDPSVRISAGLSDLGKFRQVLKTKILGLLPTLIAQLRVSPVDEPRLETELVAHGDGAFFIRHIDTDRRYHDIKQNRVLSGIYYFNAEPKAFTGGVLRLHAIGGKEGENFVDIEPVRNSLLIFLAWAPHEVLPVRCPSNRFIDSRFAINCWVHGKKPGASA
jgi:SM-20-related protein